jgi:hypothetical protein
MSQLQIQQVHHTVSRSSDIEILSGEEGAKIYTGLFMFPEIFDSRYITGQSFQVELSQNTENSPYEIYQVYHLLSQPSAKQSGSREE